MSAEARRSPRFFRPHIMMWRRPRLFSAAAVAVVLTAALFVATPWGLATRLLVGWDVGVTLYLILVFELMTGAGASEIRRRAAAQDEGQLAILVSTVGAGLVSLVAILVQLSSASGSRGPARLILAASTILLSWAFIHTMFALHYAHEFYGEDAGPGGGMAFPGGDEEPDYWDFVYFSFVIGMTSQVSDVGVTSKVIRRTVAAHGIVSFVFNAALLALTVNIAASAI
ncbi:MAG TPA: DUF1345 domain-containing protein [Methylomirabilota bacterium]|nr:DUF1345 domain-containing protein [Methylomirabilota bacterium]